jgi:phospholipid/cholesterol/gamma-HCH transport system ATP-binding protein
MSATGIVLSGLFKRFGDQSVLRGVDLYIARGEQRVILGKSGQGKSVLLKLMVGLLRPDEGSVLVDGQEVTRLSRGGLFTLRRRFGMVFQGGALFDSMTVGENIALALREHTSESEAQVRERVEGALSQVGMAEAYFKMPSELSGGMRKRASLARAIVTTPEYILYDEPTTGLDPISADAINLLIRRLDEELGITSIVVTHDMVSAFEVGRRFALLNEGHIIFEGSAEEARATTEGPMRQFIDGTSKGPLHAF